MIGYDYFCSWMKFGFFVKLKDSVYSNGVYFIFFGNPTSYKIVYYFFTNIDKAIFPQYFFSGNCDIPVLM